MVQKLRSFWRNALGRESFEDGMDAEMRFHLESRAADLERRGLSPEDAARQARLEFGSLEKQKDLARAGIGLRLLDEVVGDLRYALRTFVRQKGFTAAAVVTLALGIGANAAIFNLIDALMLRSLPVSRPGELLLLKLGSQKDLVGDPTFSYPMVQAVEAERDVFSGVAAFSGFGCSAGSGETLRRVPCAVVSGGFYETLGLVPAAGRLLARSDNQPGAPVGAVVSYGYWERQFGKSPAAVGQTLLVNGVPVTIVGVSPRGFAGANVGAAADLTIPIAAIDRLSPSGRPLLGKGNSWLRVLARLQPGVTEAQAAARLSADWPRIADASIDPQWPAFRKESVTGAVMRFEPGATGWTYLREIYVKPLSVLMTVVSLVLLIACANVASLLLARASARRKEIAVRMAIGAGRGRLVRQLLVESLALSLLGAACGIWIASSGANLLVNMISAGGLPIVFDLTPSWRILAFTTGIATATALLFGLAPALQATGFAAAAVLKEDLRTGTARLRLLPVLVTVQIALTLVLLIGAGLFVRTFRNLQLLDPGFRADGVLFVEFDRRLGGVPLTVLPGVRALPGVASATIATHTPLSGSTWSEAAVPAGQTLPERDNAVFIGAGPAFFSTLGIELVAGREFTERDAAHTPAVAIVNERYAETYFPGQNPVGRHLIATLNGQRDLEIVGVARNTYTRSLRGVPPRSVYVPYAQLTGMQFGNVVVRRTGATPNLPDELRRTLQPFVPTTPLEARPLPDQVAGTIVRERLLAALAASFGALALLLASVGVYGLLAYGVAQRTREIGIRMALGAERRKVIALVLRGARRSLVIGLAIGLPAALGASRWVESMLFGLKPTDPVAIGAAVVLLAAVAHLAAYVPALRASRVDPLVALRHE
jgi:putative ABC transport system permease protein